MKDPGQDGLPGPLDPSGMITDARTKPRPLVIAALAQALQGLLLFGVGVATLVVGITDSGEDLGNAVLVALLAGGGGAGLLAVARGLLGAQGWARSPAVVWQLITIPIGFTTRDDLPGVGYALLASAVVVLFGLFAPASGEALGE